MKTLYIYSEDNGITWNKKEYLIRAANRLGLTNVVAYNNQPNPEYVLNIEPYEFNFIRGSKWTGIWDIDLLIHNGGRYYDECDDIFLAIGPVPNNPKYHYLPQACDTEVHRPLPGEKEVDFLLSGTAESENEVYRERGRVIRLLKETYSFQDYGKRHRPADYVEYLNKGRVQFIRSMEVNGVGEIAQRFFECLAIGPVLTNYCPDLEHLGLIEGVDYFSYKNDEEMLEKMKRLIEDEKFRNDMAASGRKKALLYHTYEHRLFTIFNTYESK